MRALTALFSILTVSFVAGAAPLPPVLSCAYSIMSAPFSTVEVRFDADGTPQPMATIIVSGKSHEESVTPEALGPGESAHLWLSKESDQNSIEMIVYEQRQPQGHSKLINPHIPFGKIMWGECTGRDN